LVRDPAYRCAWVATRIVGTEVPPPRLPDLERLVLGADGLR
jgi:hypothetical protein